MKLFHLTAITLMAFATLTLPAQENLLPNANFEDGETLPTKWQPPVKGAEWLKTGGVDDTACISTHGDSTTAAAWRSDPIELMPRHLYRLSFAVRTEGGGGTVVCGTDGANVDVGVPGAKWTLHEHTFATAPGKQATAQSIRLGQWNLNGAAFFDNVTLALVSPVHAAFDGTILGAGETIEGNSYRFEAPWSSENRNYSRPLHGFSATFNTDRWSFSTGGALLYRHQIAGRNLLSGTLKINSGYYISGVLRVDVSKDGQEWQHVGVLQEAGTLEVAVPAALFPTEHLIVRMRGTTPNCSLQLHNYEFEAQVDGTAAHLGGSTAYIEVLKEVPRFKVVMRGLGDMRPGGANLVEFNVRNNTGAAQTTQAHAIFSQPGHTPLTNSIPVEIPAGGAFNVQVPYEIPGIGLWQMVVELGDVYSARTSLRVPDFYAENYGELLPVNNPTLNLWRASSGWKVPQHRRLPRTIAKGLSLRLARNEWESIQLVVTPNEPLANVVVSVSELTLGNHKIAADALEVRRVGYVPVNKKTDKSGVIADWPDPLLPQSTAQTLAADVNQPYWICVKAPTGTPAGIYRGVVTVAADNLKVTTPLNVEVYDFELPNTLTCETAFGFNPSTVFRYHGVKDQAQQRELLHKYLCSYRDHHLSIYNPTPLDGWSYTWTGLPPWRGGKISTTEQYAGHNSLEVVDDSTTVNIGTHYDKLLPLPPKGFKVSLAWKSNSTTPAVLSVNYYREDGSWISGNNADHPLKPQAQWQTFETTITTYPAAARFFKLSIYAAGWHDSGATTGTLWLANISAKELEGSRELIEGGTFEPFDPNKAEPVFDWSKWDIAMQRAFDEYYMNCFRINIAGLGGGTFHSRSEPSFMGYAKEDPAYDILHGKYLRAIEAHLREKGWLDKAYVYWFDEPDPKDYEFVMNGFAQLKKHAPGLRRMLTEQVEKELVGGPNLWCPLTPSLNVPGAEEQRTAGDDFWWYVCCSPKEPYVTEFIDHPGVEMRLWLWQTWAERVSGILIWESVYWTSSAAYPNPTQPQNPYLDPMCWVSGYDTKAGVKSPWGNGDGRFLYPPLAAATGTPSAPVLDAPVPSIRLKMLRDGLEDYEYFVILKRLLAEKSAKLTPRQREDYAILLTVPPTISVSLTEFTTDPSPLEAQRDKLARAIVSLSKLN